jgi:antitoxin (DNA-binding transcriptional repressor) of toxin-antitoxin stability system
MRKKISATEAVRKFSEILSQVHYKGDSYTVVRGRKSVASISPVTQSLKGKKPGRIEEPSGCHSETRRQRQLTLFRPD